MIIINQYKTSQPHAQYPGDSVRLLVYKPSGTLQLISTPATVLLATPDHEKSFS